MYVKFPYIVGKEHSIGRAPGELGFGGGGAPRGGGGELGEGRKCGLFRLPPAFLL